MKILKKINYLVCSLLMLGLFVSFIFRFDNLTVAYIVGVIVLAEFFFIINEEFEMKKQEIEKFIQYAKILYSLDFSKLQNIKEIVINSNYTFTVILKNSFSFCYKIQLMPISQEALQELDLRFKNEKIKED